MTAPKTTEASIQATLKHALEACGYIVGEVGKARSAKAAGCYVGNTTGLPDLFITHPDWPTGEWLGLELKTPTGKVRPEQQRLADAGRVVICRGVAEGLRVVRDREEKLARASVVAWKLTTHYKISQMVEQFAGTAGDCTSAILGGE